MADSDTPWKEVLDAYFEAFLAFFFPAAHAGIDWARGYEFLDKELQKIIRQDDQGRRYVDKLVKVWRIDGREEWVLIHIEIQGRKERQFGRRMYDYNTRLFARYNRQVVSLAVLADERADWRPRGFGYRLWGCKVEFEFPTAKLLDYAGQEAALEANPNPFAVVVLAHLKALQTKRNPTARHSWKTRLVRGLYERGLSAEEVRNLFRFIDWVLDLPKAEEETFKQEVQEMEEERDMPYVSSIERLAREEGRHEGILECIQNQLRSSFGRPGTALFAEVSKVQDLKTLRSIYRALNKGVSLEKVRELLPKD